MITIRRVSERGSSLPRKLVAPHLNIEAQTQAELMKWEAEPLAEPLLTAALSSDEVGALRETLLSVPLTCQCHTQGIERAVKEVSEACLMVIGRRNVQPGSGAPMSATELYPNLRPKQTT